MNALEQFEEKVLLDRRQKLLKTLDHQQRLLKANYKWYMRIIGIKKSLFRQTVLYLVFKGGFVMIFFLLLICFGFGYNLFTNFSTIHWFGKGLICVITFFLCFFYVSKSTLLGNSDRWLLSRIKETESALDQIRSMIEKLKNTPKNKQSLEPVLEEIEYGMLEMEVIRWKNK